MAKLSLQKIYHGKQLMTKNKNKQTYELVQKSGTFKTSLTLPKIINIQQNYRRNQKGNPIFLYCSNNFCGGDCGYHGECVQWLIKHNGF